MINNWPLLESDFFSTLPTSRSTTSWLIENSDINNDNIINKEADDYIKKGEFDNKVIKKMIITSYNVVVY